MPYLLGSYLCSHIHNNCLATLGHPGLEAGRRARGRTIGDSQLVVALLMKLTMREIAHTDSMTTARSSFVRTYGCAAMRMLRQKSARTVPAAIGMEEKRSELCVRSAHRNVFAKLHATENLQSDAWSCWKENNAESPQWLAVGNCPHHVRSGHHAEAFAHDHRPHP